MAIKPSQQNFINELVRSGKEIDSYLIAYPKTKNRKVAATNARRLMKKDEIADAISNLQKHITAIATTQAVEELKQEIKLTVLSVSQKREILHNLATGAAEKFIHYPSREIVIDEKGDKTITTVLKRSKAPLEPYEILRAIEIDNRMAGDNAPPPGASGGSGQQQAQEIKHLHIHLTPDDIRDISKQLEDTV